MVRWVTQRILSVVFAVTFAFWAVHVLPGDYVTIELIQSGASETEIERQRDALGLNDPLTARYLRYLQGVLRGDLGLSYASGQPVTRALTESLSPTLSLAFAAGLIAVALGFFVGGMSVFSNRVGRFLSRFITTVALTTPIYWTGTLAILVFAVWLNLLPSSGSSGWQQVILPALVLGFHTSGAIARTVYISLNEVLSAPYITTAYAKGLRTRRVMGVHALRNVAYPIFTVIALQAGFLVSGTVIVEMLFVRPGLGKLLFDATLRRDYPIILGVVMITAVVYITITSLIDVLHPIIDPRVRHL